RTSTPLDIIHMYAYTAGMVDLIQKIKGRGAGENPPNRFEKIWKSRDPFRNSSSKGPESMNSSDSGPEWTEEDPAPGTEFFKVASPRIPPYIARPDLGFSASLTPYRGCEHGCFYCYARPSHEYLGFSSGLDFESKIMVKQDAPELLRKELSSPRWKPQ